MAPKKDSPIKLKADADAAEKKGDFARAIELLKLIVQDNPRDWQNVNRIGDLYAKLNKLKEANDQYVKVARYYADDGFFLKAIAVWKKVLRNDPSMLEGSRELGDLYARQGLVAEARQTLGQVYDEYVKKNRMREAEEVLRRLSELDPSDFKVKGLLADLYTRQGDQEKAAGEYIAIADELLKKGKPAEALQLIDKSLRSGPRFPKLLSVAANVHIVQKDFPRAIELLEEARRATPTDREVSLRLAESYLGSRRAADARKVLEALLQRDASDQDARLQLGQVYLADGRFDEAFDHFQPVVDKLAERRQVERGASLLQQIVQRNPQHTKTLAKLVELYRAMKNDMLVAQTYGQMVEAYMATGGHDQAASILEMLVQLEPHNDQHRTKLRWLKEQGGGAASSTSGFEVDLSQPAPKAEPVSGGPPAPAPAPRATLELSGPLSTDDQEFISEHLAEGRVFRKYGLGDKAKDQFEAVLSRFPDNLEALQELADLHKEKGDTAAAAQKLRVLVEVHKLKGESDKASAVTAEADKLAPPPAAPAPAPAAPAPAAAAPAAPPQPTARPPAQRPRPPPRLRPPRISRWTSRSTSPRPRPQRRRTSSSTSRWPRRRWWSLSRSSTPPTCRWVGARSTRSSWTRSRRSPRPSPRSTWTRSPRRRRRRSSRPASARSPRPFLPPRLSRPPRSTASPPTCAARSTRSTSTSRWASSRTRAACSPRWGRGCPPIRPSFSGSPSSASSSRRRPRWTSCSARSPSPSRRKCRARTSRCSSAKASSSLRRRTRCRRRRPRPRRPAATAKASTSPRSSEASSARNRPSPRSRRQRPAARISAMRRFRTSSASSRRVSTSSSARKTTRRATTSGSPTRRWASSTRRSPSSSWPRRTSAGCSSVRACSGCASSRRACPSWP